MDEPEKAAAGARQENRTAPRPANMDFAGKADDRASA